MRYERRQYLPETVLGTPQSLQYTLKPPFVRGQISTGASVVQ